MEVVHIDTPMLLHVSSQGKSLSIICGALKWLVDREGRDKERLDAVLEGKLPASALHGPVTATAEKVEEPSKTAQREEEPDWFTAYDEKKAESETLQRLREEVELKKRREAKLKKLREEFGSSNWRRRRKVISESLPACIILMAVFGSREVPCPLPLPPPALRAVRQKMLT